MVEDPTTRAGKLCTEVLLFARGFQTIFKGLFGNHANMISLSIRWIKKFLKNFYKINFGALHPSHEWLGFPAPVDKGRRCLGKVVAIFSFVFSLSRRVARFWLGKKKVALPWKSL